MRGGARFWYIVAAAAHVILPEVCWAAEPGTGFPGAEWLHPRIHFTPTVVSLGGGWHDIAGAITHRGVHHVFQVRASHN